MTNRRLPNKSHEPLTLLQGWRDYQAKRQRKRRRQQLKPGRPSLRKQLPHYQEQRKLKADWRLCLLIGLFTGLALVAGYFISPQSDVQQIAVNQAKTVPEQQIIDASRIKAGDNVLWQMVQRKQIEAQVQKRLPKLKKVSLTVSQSNQMTFTVKEYQTVGYLVKQKQYYPILENGVILKQKQTQAIGNSPVYSGFEKQALLKKGLAVYQSFPQNIQSAISEIRLTAKNNNPYQIHLYMNDGNEVIADLRTITDKIKYYPVLAKQMGKKGLIDLEVGAYSKAF